MTAWNASRSRWTSAAVSSRPGLERLESDLILRVCKLEGSLELAALVGAGRTDRPLREQRRDSTTAPSRKSRTIGFGMVAPPGRGRLSSHGKTCEND
jgi:hypothetical protein